MGDEADAEVIRLLGFQTIDAEQGGAGRIGRQLAADRAGRDVDPRIVGLRQGRRPEAGAGRAANGDDRREIVAGGQLGDGGVAKIAEVLVANRCVQLQRLDRAQGQVGVDRPAVAVMVARVRQGEAGEGL